MDYENELSTLLFLCTGNYYRSRFAHTLFNHLAERRGLGWRADSAGLAIERLEGAPGLLSVHAEARLRALNLPIDRDRAPRPATAAILADADRVIAIHEEEHRPLVESWHAAFAGKVEYWHVPDIDGAMPDTALDAIVQHVEALIDSLDRSSSKGGRGTLPDSRA